MMNSLEETTPETEKAGLIESGSGEHIPSVSVIIPVYNCEEYLAQCIESVLGSTLNDVEVIVVDDGSDDDSPQIAKRYSDVTLISQENRGVGDARNAGLHVARGEFVYFLDADDYVSHDFLSNIYREAVSKDLDGLLFNMQPVFETDGLRQRCSTWYDSSYSQIEYGTVYTGRELFVRLIRANEFRSYVQRCMWKRTFLLENNCYFPERISHQDEPFTMKAILLCKRISCYEENGIYRRYRNGSITTSSSSAFSYYCYFIACCEMSRMICEEFSDVPEAMERLRELFSSMLKGKEEFEHFPPEGEFPDERYLTAFASYLCFKDCMIIKDEPSNSETLGRVAAAEQIYIYGAGFWGKRIYQMLADQGLLIEAFVVSNNSGNPRAVCGTRVVERSALEVLDHKERIAIVVCIKGQGKAIAKELREQGFDAMDYLDLVAQPIDVE